MNGKAQRQNFRLRITRGNETIWCWSGRQAFRVDTWTQVQWPSSFKGSDFAKSAEPLNRRKTRTDLSTSLLPISYKYDDRETGIPKVIVTLFPWRKQLSSKICCPALQLTTWEKNQFDWRQQDIVSRFSAFCILVPLLYGFIMSWRKPFKIGP